MSKREANMQRLPKLMSFGHGTYRSRLKFKVPAGVYFIFMAPPGEILPQSVITPNFVRFFQSSERISQIFRGARPPNFLAEWKKRTYGPGDMCHDLAIDYNDPLWPGMGLKRLPLPANPFAIHMSANSLAGQRIHLSSLMSPGVYFVVSCRVTFGLNRPRVKSIETKNKSAERKFLKRGRPSPSFQLRKHSANEPSAKRRRTTT